MRNVKFFETEKISKLLIELSFPAFIGMLVMATYNLIDSFFIGNFLGQEGLYAVSLTFPFVVVQTAISLMVGIGSITLISIALGRKQYEYAEKILNSSIVLAIILGLILAFSVNNFLYKILFILGARHDYIKISSEFIEIIIYGTVFMFISFLLNAVMRVQGNFKRSMYLMLISSILNACLNPLFILYFNLGIKGSALATIITQILFSLYNLYYFSSKKSLLKIKRRYFKLDLSLNIQVLKNGMPQFIVQGITGLIIIVYNKILLIYGGPPAVASVGIINRITFLFLTPIIGITQGAQSIIGYNFGAKKYNRVIETLNRALIIGTILALFCFIVSHLYPRELIKIFSSEKLIIELGGRGLFLHLLLIPIMACQIIAASFFQAIGKPNLSMSLHLLRQTVFLFPIIYFLPQFLGLDGIWLSGSLSDLLAGFFTGIMVWNELKKLKKGNYVKPI